MLYSYRRFASLEICLIHEIRQFKSNLKTTTFADLYNDYYLSSENAKKRKNRKNEFHYQQMNSNNRFI